MMSLNTLHTSQVRDVSHIHIYMSSINKFAQDDLQTSNIQVQVLTKSKVFTLI